jgi:predicted nucleic acid-binding protein
MNWFVDTNVLIYSIDNRIPAKKERAAEWLEELARRDAVIISPQSLNEFYVVATHRLGLPRNASTRDLVSKLARWCTAPLGADVTRHAWRIEDETGYRFFDCLLLASALRAGCDFFLSEDLQHERRIGGGLTIVNPFLTSPRDFSPAE